MRQDRSQSISGEGFKGKTYRGSMRQYEAVEPVWDREVGGSNPLAPIRLTVVQSPSQDTFRDTLTSKTDKNRSGRPLDFALRPADFPMLNNLQVHFTNDQVPPELLGR